MNTTRGRPRAAVAIAVMLAVVAAACGHGGGHHPTTSSNAIDKVRPVWQEYVRCVRTHGLPSMPDAVIDNSGRATFPGVDKRALQPADAQCSAILRRLPRSAQARATQPASADDMARLRTFAQCMREHGVPDFPDPKSDGSFPAAQAPAPKPVAAIQACEHLLPAGEHGVEFS